MSYEIPKHWTGQQALLFASFLDNLSCAIWQACGRPMALELQRVKQLADVHHHRCPECITSCDDTDEEMPF
jgi:hypothetical protein